MLQSPSKLHECARSVAPLDSPRAQHSHPEQSALLTCQLIACSHILLAVQGITDGFWESHVNDAAMELFRKLLGRPVKLMIEVRHLTSSQSSKAACAATFAHHLSAQSSYQQAPSCVALSSQRS